jgi:hypothetical protein
MSDKISNTYAEILLDCYENALSKKYFPEKSDLLWEISRRLISSVENEEDKETIRFCLGQMDLNYRCPGIPYPPYITDMKKQILRTIEKNCNKEYDVEKVLNMFTKEFKEEFEAYFRNKKC